MKQFNLEAHITELEAIELSFRSPEFNLEKALLAQKRAEQLATEILKYLDTAETKLETLAEQPN